MAAGTGNGGSAAAAAPDRERSMSGSSDAIGDGDGAGTRSSNGLPGHAFSSRKRHRSEKVLERRSDNSGFEGSKLSSALSWRKRHRLENMFDDERYADCSVLVGPRDRPESFRVNRFALAQSSDVFGKMLFETPMCERNGQVVLESTTPDAFRQFLRCAHHLEPTITSENFVEVMQLAQAYCVEDLLEVAEAWAEERASSPVQALELLDAAESFINSTVEQRIAEILSQCMQTVLTRLEEAFDDRAFVCCGSPVLLRLLASDDLACNEEHLWHALVSRSRQQGVNAPWDSLQELVPHVRFNVMTPAFFVDEVLPTGALAPERSIAILSAFATKRASACCPKGPRAKFWKWSTVSHPSLSLSSNNRTVYRSAGARGVPGRSFTSAIGAPPITCDFQGVIKLRVDTFVTGSSGYDSFVMIGLATSALGITEGETVAPWASLGEANPNSSFLASFGSPSYHFNSRFPGSPPHLKAGSLVQIHLDMPRRSVRYALDDWNSAQLALPSGEAELRVLACFLAYTDACSATVSFVS